MLGGVQLYKEPLLLPTENLPMGLGDTRKLSASNGLEGRTDGQCVIHAQEDIRAQTGPKELRGNGGPGVAGSSWGHRHSLRTLGLDILTPLGHVSESHHPAGPKPDGKGQPSATTHVGDSLLSRPPQEVQQASHGHSVLSCAG